MIILYLVLALIIPRGGFWTIDNGLKYLAIHEQAHHPLQSFNITIPDSHVDPWNEAAPLIPPFVYQHNDKLVPVFPPLFIVLCSIAWKFLGQWIIWWIPLIASLGIFAVCWLAYRNNLSGTNLIVILLLGLASPMAFYALSLWEHTTSILFLLLGIVLTYRPEESSSLWKWIIGGILLGVGGMFRLECWIVAVSWAIASFHYRHRVRWTAMVMGLVLAAVLWLASNFWWTGSFWPLQFGENWKMYGLSGEHSGIIAWIVTRWESFVNLIVAAHPRLMVNIVLNAAMILGIALALIIKKRKIANLGFGLIIGTYIVFLIQEWRLDHPVAGTAFTGGLLWCCPWVILAIFAVKKKDLISRRLLTAILLAIVLIILITPISRGIHFGPRILLPLIPLFAILTSRAIDPGKGWKTVRIAAWILVGLTVIHQGRGIDLLAKQKAVNADLTSRVIQLEQRVIVTDLWWIPSDFARAWDNHSFFYISGFEVFADLLYHMKINGLEEFAYCSESPATIADVGLPIKIEKQLRWASGERSPIVAEIAHLVDDPIRWAELATQIGMHQIRTIYQDRALGPFEAAVDWNPLDPDNWYRLGMLKMQMWDEDGAREAFETAVDIDSTHQRSLKALRRWRNVR